MGAVGRLGVGFVELDLLCVEFRPFAIGVVEDLYSCIFIRGEARLPGFYLVC